MAPDDGQALSSETKLSAGLIITAIIAVALIVFIFQNTDSTEVTWLFVDAEPPLWLALLASAVAGAVLSELGGWLIRRRRRRG